VVRRADSDKNKKMKSTYNMLRAILATSSFLVQYSIFDIQKKPIVAVCNRDAIRSSNHFKPLLLLLIIFLPSFTFSQLNAYQKKTWQSQNGEQLNYRILYPQNFDKQKSYPLVMFFHGGGERGSDNEKQLVHGAQMFLDSINSYQAIVIFPQCAKGDYWANLSRPDKGGANRVFTFHTDKGYTPSMRMAVELMESLLAKSYVDEQRLYVTGLSMGGFGTWELLWRMPEKIAAAAPICGGGPMDKTAAMAGVPIWAFHGVKDNVVHVRYTKRMIPNVQKNGGIAKVSLYPNVGHNSWDHAFKEERFLSWLFKHRNERIQPSKEDQFLDSLLNLMTIEERIGQLNLLTPGGSVTGSVVSENVEKNIKEGNVGGIFGIRGAEKVQQAQKIAVENSRLGIPLIVGMDVIHGHQTIVPIPLGLSCSWDMDLIERTAQMSAREATANGIMWTFSPMVDISRDPRWGRISEGAGEDPFLGSAIARAMVHGYQQDDLSDPLSMIACVKHFAAYGAAEGGRDYATVDMSRQRLLNEYLPPYEAAIKAGVGTVMTSFNVVDYMPVTANDYLFEDILRDEWGFDGMVVTDYTAINEMIAHGLGDLQQVSALALKAGIDMDMVGEGFVSTLKKSLDEGKVTEKDINIACRRVLRTKYQLGLFDDPYRYFDAEREKAEILSDKNRSIAREAAGKSFVLLKNEKNILPLKKNTKIALVGPLADSRRNMLGTWSVSGDHDAAVTVLEAFQKAASNKNLIRHAKGANISDDPIFAKKVNVFGEEITIDKRSPDAMIREAVAAARQSDVVVAVVGEAADMSGEASSMANIGLQPSQMKLLKALKATGKPIIMVLYNGRPMTLNWESENMDAILDVWFGGTEGASAIADVLYGDVNPSGKLTTSFPIHVGQIPVYHSMLNTGRPYNGEAFSKFKSNYLDIPNQPLYPFGYGLSYTTFEYSNLQISDETLSAGSELTVSVEIKNTGKRTGEEVVQLYIRDVVGSISRPMKEFKGFEKISLAAGESKTVEFTITEDLLNFYNADLERVVEAVQFEVFVGGSSVEVEKVGFEYR